MTMKKVRYPFVLNYKRADKGPERLCHVPMITCWWAHALSYFCSLFAETKQQSCTTWKREVPSNSRGQGNSMSPVSPGREHLASRTDPADSLAGVYVADRSASLSQPEETIHQDFFQQTLLLWFQGPLKYYCDFLGKGRPWPRHTNLLVHLKVSAVTVNK